MNNEFYCIVSMHLYSASHRAHESEALPLHASAAQMQ